MQPVHWKHLIFEVTTEKKRRSIVIGLTIESSNRSLWWVLSLYLKTKIVVISYTDWCKKMKWVLLQRLMQTIMVWFVQASLHWREHQLILNKWMNEWMNWSSNLCSFPNVIILILSFNLGQSCHRSNGLFSFPLFLLTFSNIFLQNPQLQYYMQVY